MMLSVAQARARILEAFAPVGIEWVALTEGLGRVLAQDLHARRTQPPADVSAMDGYAVQAADTEPPGRWLEVIGESRAGGDPCAELAAGQAARIFTGAPLPAGADGIAIQENAERNGSRVRFSRATRPGEFVRKAGLDFSEGWRGLISGTVMEPRSIGLAAALGHVWLPVRRRPRIAVLATGDELARPGEAASPNAIVSSNSLVIGAYVRAWGGEVVDLGVAADRAESLIDALRDLGGIDLVVTSGGASVGEYDLVQQALGQEGLEVDFWKIAMRPGKPLIFGRLRGIPFLGLPGNPVSAAVCSIVYMRAAMMTLLGLSPDLPVTKAWLASDLGANDEREDYLRATIAYMVDDLPVVEPAGRQDSSMFATLARADALVIRPALAPSAVRHSTVDILLLKDILRTG